MSDFKCAAEAAEAALRASFAPTPCQLNAHLSAKYGAEIWLKREDLAPVRSYKIRGAMNAMRKYLAEFPDQKLFVCASAGNHAQGVAYACKHFGVKGVIFMPVTTPQQKIAKTKVFGGEAIRIELVGDYFDDTLASSQAYCDAQGGYFLSPFDDADVIEGQASVAVEMVAQMPELPDMVILPVGGGGLSAGMTRYLAQVAPQVALRYVEPLGGMSLAGAVAAGAPVTLPRVDSFVDGAAVARIGAQPFELLRNVKRDQVLAAPEDRICGTMLEMLNVEGIVLEPAGALSVDALAELGPEIRGKRVVCVTSGGNFDFERLPEVKERSQRYLGLKKYFIIRMPQRPGALRDFLELLGPQDDIARFEYLKKSARNFGSVLIGIETQDPANFASFLERLSASDMEFRDITTDKAIAEFVL
ncbi:L-threonine dehydratase biosynthetic IlvA [Aquimixticola soesokkakensis]|uniref:L-threonine dehydratase n=1 Tax=Aquimixticola soesokkakensis TaxID=1519096 RepID=A0A1Y5R847_9RHOB|nr:threonine ammonia-lyase IlvA [Aquimixticola soesokkakensis]SLN11324.1 L-threonine dehydratase biosynthetic IlvA [Aquimixticola soesokkakensis]